jgi:hypothetical protein
MFKKPIRRQEKEERERGRYEETGRETRTKLQFKP